MNNCMYCEECIKTSEKLDIPNAVFVQHKNPNVFRFVVEVCG
jgi:hypothetical protein